MLALLNHRGAEAVQLRLRLALGRLDHQRAGDRERHRRGMEAIVDQALGDIVDRDPGRILEHAGVEDAFVRDAAVTMRSFDSCAVENKDNQEQTDPAREICAAVIKESKHAGL